MSLFTLKTLTAISLTLTAAAVAAPTWGGSTGPHCTSTAVVANLDELTVLPGTDPRALPTPYKGLFYQAFVAATGLGLPLVPIEPPHSPPN